MGGMGPNCYPSSQNPNNLNKKKNNLLHLTDFLLQALSGQEKRCVIVIVKHINISTILK